MYVASIRAELLVRLFLIIFFYATDKASCVFFRQIQPEEYWLYSFPKTSSYYPSIYLWLTVFLTPLAVVGITFIYTKDKVDAYQSLMGSYLSLYLAGSITNCVKLGVGRPRPDFMSRCFPDGKIIDPMNCKGPMDDVIEGRKSFPSGHSSLSFSVLAFIAFYLAGKLHVFTSVGKRSAWRLVCVILPLLWGTMIAVSRTADYHHHWQDVLVGSLLGITVAYLVYRAYYPSLQRHTCHLPYASIPGPESSIMYNDKPLSPTMANPSHMEQLMKSV